MVHSIVTTSGNTHIHSDVLRFGEFQIFNLQGRFDNDFDSYKIDLIFFGLTTPPVRGHALAQLVEALSYNPEGRGFDS